MAFTWTLDNQLSWANLTAVNDIANTTFEGLVNVAYTVLSFLVSFFTQPTVIWIIVAILIGYMFYRKFKAKIKM